MNICFIFSVLLFFAALANPAFHLSGSAFAQSANGAYLPIKTSDRGSWKTVRLTSIGEFGLQRKARPGIPAHLHTGADLSRPGENYKNEPVYPILPGKVISMRDDGPFAQIIIEHFMGKKIWSVYEHVAGISVSVGEIANPHRPIARFMNRGELKKYGRQFDHLHFEIMKIKPRTLRPGKKTPYRFFGTYSLVCYTKADLNKYYYDPKSFFSE